jgi:hypothetical protein
MSRCHATGLDPAPAVVSVFMLVFCAFSFRLAFHYSMDSLSESEFPLRLFQKRFDFLYAPA